MTISSSPAQAKLGRPLGKRSFMRYSVLGGCEKDARGKVSKSDARTSQMLPK